MCKDQAVIDVFPAILYAPRGPCKRGDARGIPMTKPPPTRLGGGRCDGCGLEYAGALGLRLYGDLQIGILSDVYLGGVWVAAGDYKRAPDPTCAPFEPVPCETFITESTFGLPIYQWQPQQPAFVCAGGGKKVILSFIIIQRTCIFYKHSLALAGFSLFFLV